jgi:hypothetical protein
VKEIPIDEAAKECLSNVNAVGVALHLRLRYAQHGFTPAPAQRNRGSVKVRG